MKTIPIKSTRDYSLFAIDPENRAIRNVNKLIASMKKHGFLPSHPIVVYRLGSKLVVRDGQHRLEAAKALKLPVYYVEEPAGAQVPISDMQVGVGGWNLNDYVGSYRLRGNQDYDTLATFAAEHGLRIQVAASLLVGHQAASGNANGIVKTGGFKVRDLAYANSVALVTAAASKHVAWYSNTYFVDAVSKCLRVQGCTSKDLAAKIEKRPELLKHYGTTAGFLEMLEAIFNHGARKPLPLKFLAEQSAKERSAVHHK